MLSQEFFEYARGRISGCSRTSPFEHRSSEGGSVEFINGMSETRKVDEIEKPNRFVIDDYYPPANLISKIEKTRRDRFLFNVRQLGFGSNWVSQGSSNRVKIKQPNSATGMVSGEIPEREVNGSP